MKLFKCSTEFQTIEIIELPKNMYRVRINKSPAKVKIALTLAVIILISVAYALLF